MKSKQFIPFIFLAILVSSCHSKDSNITTKKTTEIINGDLGLQLDSLLTPYVINLRKLTDNNAGLAIGVTKGENLIYAKTFGYASIEDSIEADFKTLFHIASVSKPFTASAIIKLVGQGKIKLDDYIIDYIPEFKMKSDGYELVTIKQALTHTSGIPREVTIDGWENPIIGKDALEKNLEFVKDFELDFEPGSEFNYSNTAIDILGIVVARVSGMSFEEFVTEQILKPAGMNNSRYSKPDGKLPKDWAVPYSYGLKTQEWSPYPYSENYFPSSGLQTTLLDMCNWGKVYANGGENVFTKKEFELLTTPHYKTPWDAEIGLSWYLQSYLDRPIIMHTGNDTGFESLMYVYPKDSISIIVMANRDFARTGRLINAVSEFIYEKNAKDYNVSAKYKFTDAYNKMGIEYAKKLWFEMKKDTNDIYFTEDEDILTTGAVLENGKNWQASKEILEFYISLDRQSAYAWRLLGNANLNLGDKETAKSCYEQTLKINPDYEKGKEALEALIKMKN